ncbi:Rv1733c family protein [Haloechinothrix halophila]|uniref:Rv1733c family protein n=1 Tax=Haloechinothrix halophila TaxID=1069073 RepID=UPI000420FC5C|nr:hypothetical protein [Haloechinothrix halophila]
MFGTSSGPVLWSALHPGGNPLIRPSDRRQARFTAVLIALALLAGPFMAAYAFSYHATLTDRAETQQDDRYRVDAVLLEDAPATRTGGATAFQMPRQSAALAEWSTQDRARHVGVIPVAGGTSAGEAVTIWVDSDGNRTTAPLSVGQTAAASVLVALGTWLMFVAALAGIYLLLCVRLDHDRYAEWEREWRKLDERRT